MLRVYGQSNAQSTCAPIYIEGRSVRQEYGEREQLTMKKYLQVKPAISSGATGFLQNPTHYFEWSDNPDKATADYRQSAEITQRDLRNQLGLETTLVERRMDEWVICREWGENQKEDFKTILRGYHADLMKIENRYRSAPNSQPNEKNQAAQAAGTDFAARVSDFDSQ